MIVPCTSHSNATFRKCGNEREMGWQNGRPLRSDQNSPTDPANEKERSQYVSLHYFIYSHGIRRQATWLWSCAVPAYEQRTGMQFVYDQGHVSKLHRLLPNSPSPSPSASVSHNHKPP